MNRSTALLLVTAVLFFIGICILPLDVNGFAMMQEKRFLVSLLFIIPGIITGIATSVLHYREENLAIKTCPAPKD